MVSDYNNVDEYISSFPLEVQDKLNEMRKIIKEVVPEETTEKIAWDMPTFYLYGNLVHFAAAKKHIGFYPGSSGVEYVLDEIPMYKSSKGTIQFPLNQELPKKLIQKIVRFKVNENIEDYQIKTKK